MTAFKRSTCHIGSILLPDPERTLSRNRLGANKHSTASPDGENGHLDLSARREIFLVVHPVYEGAGTIEAAGRRCLIRHRQLRTDLREPALRKLSASIARKGAAYSLTGTQISSPPLPVAGSNFSS